MQLINWARVYLGNVSVLCSLGHLSGLECHQIYVFQFSVFRIFFLSHLSLEMIILVLIRLH